MSAQGTAAKAGRTKRIVVAGAILAALVAVGVVLALYAANAPETPDYSGLSAEPSSRPVEPKPKTDKAAEPDSPSAEQPAEEPERPLASPSANGALRVEGAQLVDAAGNPVQLRGVSTHGIAWFPQYVNQPLFNELHQAWGANVVRLAVYSAESGGYATDGRRSALRDLIMQGVEYATAADMYAVVDWHILSDGNPWTNEWVASDFFAIISRDLADHDNVIYEICNEPNGSTTWADIKSYAKTIIPIIRANDPDAVIVVGTPNWSQDVEAAAADRLSASNIMYAMHFYAATHQDDLRARLRTAVQGGLPVFVSEFGICEASGDGEIDYESADEWVRLLDELNVSYICWNLSNKNEAAALFKPDAAKTSGFTLEDLSDEGLWLLDTLGGPGFDPKELQLARADKKPNAEGAAMMAFAEGTIQWQLNVTETWEADGRTFFKYEMAGNNYGARTDGWSVTIPFSADVQLEDAWNCQASAAGNELTLVNADHNGEVAAGAFVREVGFIVSGPANLAVVDL